MAAGDQEAEAVARQLRELCIRNSIALPAELEGTGGSGSGARGEAHRPAGDGAGETVPCQVPSASSGVTAAPLPRVEPRQEVSAPAAVPVTAEVATQAVNPALVVEPTHAAPVEEVVPVRNPECCVEVKLSS